MNTQDYGTPIEPVAGSVRELAHGDTSENIKPFIEGDTIVNATRGKLAVLTCIVHNVKNYKVIYEMEFQNFINRDIRKLNLNCIKYENCKFLENIINIHK